jgi:hypothetical protein
VKEPAEPGDKARDVTPEGFAVRSLAQEYGGGAFAVQGDVVVFSNDTDQRLYKQTIGGKGAEHTFNSDHCPSWTIPVLTSCLVVTIVHLMPNILDTPSFKPKMLHESM